MQFYQCYRDLGTARWSGTSISANDAATSVSNKGNFDPAEYWVNATYKGSSFWLPTDTGDGNLGDGSGNVRAGFNNVISSARFSSFFDDCA